MVLFYIFTENVVILWLGCWLFFFLLGGREFHEHICPLSLEQSFNCYPILSISVVGRGDIYLLDLLCIFTTLLILPLLFASLFMLALGLKIAHISEKPSLSDVLGLLLLGRVVD